MLLSPGTQDRYISETTVGAGSTVREGSIESDSLLATLWVDSVSSGNLSISLYTLTDTGKEDLLFSFPTIVTGTVNLLRAQSSVSLQRFKIVATYTGVAQYEVYVRAVSGGGATQSKILGSTNWRVSQVTVGTSATLLIPAALTDRNGVVLKNWSGTANVYVGESNTAATLVNGYPMAPRDGLALDIAAGASVWAVSDTPGADIRIGESGG